MCFKIFFKPTFLVNCVITCKFELNKLSTIIGYLLAHLLTLRVFFLCSWAEGSCINFFFFLIKFPISLECMLGFGEYEDCLCAIGWRRICSGRTGSCSTPTEHWTLYTVDCTHVKDLLGMNIFSSFYQGWICWSHTICVLKLSLVQKAAISACFSS